jgi:hypothetical protein
MEFSSDLRPQPFVAERGRHYLFCNCFSAEIWMCLSGLSKAGMPGVLNRNDPHRIMGLNVRPIGNSTTRRCDLGVWRDGSVLKNTDCSSRGPEFNSQQQRGGSQPSVIRSAALFWCVWRQLQCTHVYKINTLKKKPKTKKQNKQKRHKKPKPTNQPNKQKPKIKQTTPSSQKTPKNKK